MSTQRTRPVPHAPATRRSLSLTISQTKPTRAVCFGLQRSQHAPTTVRLTAQQGLEVRRALETEVKRMVIACASSSVQDMPALRSQVEASLDTLSDVLSKLAGSA